MAFKFSQTESAASSEFMKPGVYRMKVVEVKAANSKKKGTPFLAITFHTEDSQKHTENFMLTENALGRLQYFHEAWSGKKIAKDMNTVEEVEAYFKKAFLNVKAGVRNIILGGEIVAPKNNVFAALPYTDFIVADGEIELGEFEEGDDNWKKYVRKGTRTSETSEKKNGLLNDAGEDDNKGTDAGATASKDAAKDDLPW